MAQDFRHSVQAEGEMVADYVRRLERLLQVAYDMDRLGPETREALLHSQLQEGLRYDLMKSPAVSRPDRQTTSNQASCSRNMHGFSPLPGIATSLGVEVEPLKPGERGPTGANARVVNAADDPLEFLYSSESEDEDEVRRTGEARDHRLAGSPVKGVINSGTDITIMGAASVTHLKRSSFNNIRWEDLHGKIDLDISFDDRTMKTQNGPQRLTTLVRGSLSPAEDQFLSPRCGH